MNFTHLHVHSHYSLLDGLGKIDELLKKAKDLGMSSLALTDHGAMYGVAEFYRKAKKLGIKPIIGCEIYLAPRRMEDKTAKIDTSPHHLTLLAKNQQGYQNLIQITTQAHLKGYYYKPRIDKEFLKKHTEGLIALSGCLQGEISQLLLTHNLKAAEEKALEYQKNFGPGNFYLELQHHDNIEDQKIANKGLIGISQKTKIPLIATSDVHYSDPEDAEAHDVLLCVQTNKTVNDKNRLSMLDDDFSLKPTAKMIENFKDTPEAIENTQKISQACNLEIEPAKDALPVFKLPPHETSKSYLLKLALKGLKEKFKISADIDGNGAIKINPKWTSEEKKVVNRLIYEFKVIAKVGFEPYFLIVADLISWARKQKILTGPGRGSAASSLVSYLLGITTIDPLKYDLLFERFLNPDRISPPDFDLDFADDRRDEVIDYVTQKYGAQNVAQIITFGTMAARNAVRDCGRALGLSYSFVDRIAKMIPFNMKLQQALDNVPELSEEYQKDPQVKKMIDLSLKLEGVVRHASTHAAGVVITNKPLTDYIPLQKAVSGGTSLLTQFSMYELEELGLLKMDFLGLANLTVIQNALKIIEKTKKKKIILDKIPLDDEATFKTLARAETTGVFQLECLAGETIVSNTTIKNLSKKRNKKVLESVYLNEGKVHKNKIINVWEGKEKDLYTLIADNNWCIRASRDHNFLTENGWKKLRNIKRGEKVLVKTRANHLIYNTCKKCRKQINGQKEGIANFCYKCSAQFYKNPSRKESKKNISKAMLKFYKQGGVPWNSGESAENNQILRKTGKKISKALSGRSLEDLWGKERAEKFKKYLSARSTGSNNPMFGKPAPHRNGGFRRDLGHYVRSTWEADFARILKIHKMKYKYEPKRFRLIRPNGDIIHYTPDFYVESNNTIYEIKGWMHDLDKEKIKLFQQQYPKYNFILISATKFAEFALQYKKLINWECPQIPIQNSFKFIKIKEIKYSGREKTYDIAMRSPGNNYIANGFLVHNSEGMKRYLKELRPTQIDDIIAMVALYRPGPMGLIPDYIAGKYGQKDINYLHPKLEPILKDTYGIAVYQEQVLEIAKTMAGFTLGEADILRKAVGKKIRSLLMEQKKKFLKGAKNQGISDKVARQLFEYIQPFASYGFNKAHATCYAYIAYQTAFLKTRFPSEFMAALLTSDKNNIDRIAIEVAECKRMGIEVLPPDVNRGFGNFTVLENGDLSFGLDAIKNVGTGAVRAIVEARKKGGPFKSLEDFCQRVDMSQVNKKVLESLIKSGAMDKLGERAQMLIGVENILKFAQKIRQAQASGQIGLFDTGSASEQKLDSLSLNKVDPVEKRQKLAWERELLGIYISDHPLAEFENFLLKNTHRIASLNGGYEGKKVQVGGIITKIQKIITRNNEPMAFVCVEDLSQMIEVLVFPKILTANPGLWQKDALVLVSGKVNSKDGQMKVLADEVRELSQDSLTEIVKKQPKASRLEELFLEIPESGTKYLLMEIKTILEAYQGQSPVRLNFSVNGQSRQVKITNKVRICPELIQKLKAILGSERIIIK